MPHIVDAAEESLDRSLTHYTLIRIGWIRQAIADKYLGIWSKVFCRRSHGYGRGHGGLVSSHGGNGESR